MRFQRFHDRYIVRLAKGEKVIEQLEDFLRAQEVEFASITAAGAVCRVTLEYWDAKTKGYKEREIEEQLEVVAFQGNAALKDGKPKLHIHGVFGREDFSVYGGHVKEATAYPTLEVWLRTEDVPVRRTADPETGLDLLDLPERISSV